MKKYFWNLFIAADQLLNTIFGGDPDETISSRAGKAAREGNRFAIALCKFLNIFDECHCERSIESDRGKPPIDL